MRRLLAGSALACLVAASGCRDDGARTNTAPGTTAPPAGAPAAPAAESTATTPAADSSSDSIWVGDPPTLVPGPLTTAASGWTTRTLTVARGAGVATLRDVRTAGHPGFDRVVFNYDTALPGFHIEYVDRPAYACGSGEPLYLDGDAWLLVRMQPARAHTDAGEPTVTTRRERFDLPVLREAALTCDFEADVSWVLGLSAPGGYRVSELTGPARLVVDVRR